MSGQDAGQIAFQPRVLREELDRRGWRAAHVAVELDVDPRTVSRWLSGDVPPNGSNLRRLAMLFGRRREYFEGPLNVDREPEPEAAA